MLRALGGMAAPTTSAHCEPQAVVNGVFLYLGRKVMQGNQFLVRLRALAVPLPLDLDTKSPAERSILVLGRDAALTFTGLQLACLAVLWALKLTPGLGMVFPAAIGVLMFMRAQLLPRVFTRRQLGVIDTPIWNIRRSEEEAVQRRTISVLLSIPVRIHLGKPHPEENPILICIPDVPISGCRRECKIRRDGLYRHSGA